jgi:hypothetical protein
MNVQEQYSLAPRPTPVQFRSNWNIIYFNYMDSYITKFLRVFQDPHKNLAVHQVDSQRIAFLEESFT